VSDHPVFDFERYDAVAGIQEEFGELPGSGADFKDQRAFRAANRVGDVLEDAGIAEEMLSEGFPRAWTGGAGAWHSGSRPGRRIGIGRAPAVEPDTGLAHCHKTQTRCTCGTRSGLLMAASFRT